MRTANFQQLSTLSIQNVQTNEMNALIDNQRSTVINTFVNKVGTFLNLIDESLTTKKYTPLQMHFHAPSEHTFNGKHYDLELHIVHANEDISALSVIGIVFDV